MPMELSAISFQLSAVSFQFFLRFEGGSLQELVCNYRWVLMGLS